MLNVAIHSLVMTMVVRVAHHEGAQRRAHPSLFLIAVMIPTVSILMIAHTVEVVVWSLVYTRTADLSAIPTRLTFVNVL